MGINVVFEHRVMVSYSVLISHHIDFLNAATFNQINMVLKITINFELILVSHNNFKHPMSIRAQNE